MPCVLRSKNAVTFAVACRATLEKRVSWRRLIANRSDIAPLHLCSPAASRADAFGRGDSRACPAGDAACQRAGGRAPETGTDTTVASATEAARPKPSRPKPSRPKPSRPKPERPKPARPKPRAGVVAFCYRALDERKRCSKCWKRGTARRRAGSPMARGPGHWCGRRRARLRPRGARVAGPGSASPAARRARRDRVRGAAGDGRAVRRRRAPRRPRTGVRAAPCGSRPSAARDKFEINKFSFNHAPKRRPDALVALSCRRSTTVRARVAALGASRPA